MPSKKRILFIDDEEILCETVSDDLEEGGYAIATATSGKEGIVKFKANDYDMVITDLIMEGMTGLEVIKEIRSLKPETPILILTGQGSMETAIAALQMEVQDYILKPVKRDDFLRKIEKHLHRKPANGQPPARPRATYNPNLKFRKSALTPRECEVGQLAADGFNDNEIAGILDISAYTVKFHLKKVFKKLNIHKRVDLILTMGSRKK